MSEALLRRVGAFVSSKRKRFGAGLISLGFVLAIMPSIADSQEFRATVTGTVSDASGAKIPGARVEIGRAHV